jgi:phosphopantetheinyl transferase
LQIYSFEELKQKSLKELPHMDELTYFILDSKTTTSDALKQHLSLLVGNDSGAFIRGPDGKPAFADSSYQFNLSHSGEFTAVALHPKRELGIDIESWKTKTRMSPIAHRYYSEAEKQSLLNLSNDDWETQALSIWTIKEAMIKLKGGTLFQGISKINAVPIPKEILFQDSVFGQYFLSIAV